MSSIFCKSSACDRGAHASGSDSELLAAVGFELKFGNATGVTTGRRTVTGDLFFSRFLELLGFDKRFGAALATGNLLTLVLVDFLCFFLGNLPELLVLAEGCQKR